MRLALLLALTGFLAAACDAPEAPPRPSVRVSASPDLQSEKEAASATPWTPLGLQVKEVPQSALKALGVAYGVMVTKVRAPADRSRILPGDVIVGVNQTRIRNVEEFNSLIADQSQGTIGLLIRRADADLYIAFEVASSTARRNPGDEPHDASRGGGAPAPEESFKARRRTARDKPLRT